MTVCCNCSTSPVCQLVVNILTTMYNIVSGHMDFPSSIFVQSNLPYHLNRISTFNFTRPFAHTNYMYHSFVPSVITFWNNLPDWLNYVLLSPHLKGPCCIILRHMYHISYQLHSCCLCHL